MLVWGLRIPSRGHLSIIKRTSPVVTLWEFQTPPFLVTCIGSVLEVGLTPRVRAVIGDTLTLSVTSAFTHFSSWNFFYIIVQTDPAHSFSCIFQVYLSCFFPHSYCYSVYLSSTIYFLLPSSNQWAKKKRVTIDLNLFQSFLPLHPLQLLQVNFPFFLPPPTPLPCGGREGTGSWALEPLAGVGEWGVGGGCCWSTSVLSICVFLSVSREPVSSPWPVLPSFCPGGSWLAFSCLGF